MKFSLKYMLLLLFVFSVIFAQKPSLNGVNVLFVISEDDFSDEELFPFIATRNEYRATTFISSVFSDSLTSKSGKSIRADLSPSSVVTERFCALILIGNTDNSDVQKIIKDFFSLEKPVVAFGSSVLMLANTGVLKGIPVACSSSREDIDKLTESGAKPFNQDIVIHKNIITSQNSQSSSEIAFLICGILSPVPSIQKAE
jgi:putative intracellular protease/amidase